MLSKVKHYSDLKVSIFHVWNNSRIEKMHEIEISYVNKMMLNQTFKNKIGLSKNVNIHKNIYYENIEIKGMIQIVTRPLFQ